jgi:methylglutaconyl-CoA hydratase
MSISSALEKDMQYITYTKSARMGVITLNRPEKRNALSFGLVSEVKKALKDAEEDSEVSIIIIRAAGEVFCSGADLASLQELLTNTYEENLSDSLHLKELYQQIYTLKKIVIAQVQGHALAGGCGLATVCDFSFAVPEATFGYTEVKIGFIPAIVMIFLLRKIGEANARPLLLSGKRITAEEAVKIGLINYITDRKNLERDVHQFALDLIKNNSMHATMLTKQMIAQVQNLSFDKALEYAAEMNAGARMSDDCIKGINAFLNKTKVNW